MADPSTAIDRARDTYKQLGRSDKWIQQRMSGQETRNKLTDYWKDHEINKPEEFAILTNIIHKEWSGLTVKEIYKNCFENASQKSPNKTKKVNKFRVIIETILLGMYFAAMFCFILFIPQIKQFPVGIDTLFHPFVG